MNSSNKIKVLIIDDSALIRQLLSKILSSAADVEVVGTASDPLIAQRKIVQLRPDVLTLDIEMPHMDGLQFLHSLMQQNPLPVVMISALTQRGAEATLQALEYGAVDVIGKPQLDIAETFETYTQEIIQKIRAAAKARLSAVRIPTQLPQAKNVPFVMNIPPKFSADVILEQKKSHVAPFRTTDKVIAIGASTGGIEAIRQILTELPADNSGIVISQHIPPVFSSSFARRMDQLCAVKVLEAVDGCSIVRGCVYIAPGNQHLLVDRDGARYICRLSAGAPVNRHRPSVDVLFRSMAQNVGQNGIGVILTGMGDDGARGIQEMHEAGAVTIAQDEQSSVIWGMPGEAVKRGAIDYVLPLAEISKKLIVLSRLT